MKISSRPLESVDRIADDFIAKAKEARSLETEEYQAFIDTPVTSLHAYHHGLGRNIRNLYRLWEENHPLTAGWHAHPELRDIRNGTDFSKNHPDAVSMDIIRAIHRKLSK